MSSSVEKTEEPKLKFFGLATTEGPRKYLSPASIAVGDGSGPMHFLPLFDSELRQLVAHGTEYLRQKAERAANEVNDAS